MGDRGFHVVFEEHRYYLSESWPALHWSMQPMCVERVIDGSSTFFA
jgi:hypothetical protein